MNRTRPETLRAVNQALKTLVRCSLIERCSDATPETILIANTQRAAALVELERLVPELPPGTEKWNAEQTADLERSGGWESDGDGTRRRYDASVHDLMDALEECAKQEVLIERSETASQHGLNRLKARSKNKDGAPFGRG